MRLPSVPDMLRDLRFGPYRGRGGATALAVALGVHMQSLKLWRSGAREPTYEHRQAIAALWQKELET